MPPNAQVYPLAFKQGMMLAAKCEGFAHGIAVSMPGCNTTQARHRLHATPQNPGSSKLQVTWGLVHVGCPQRHN